MISFGHLSSSELTQLIPDATVKGTESIITSLGLPTSGFAPSLLVFAEAVGHLRAVMGNPSVRGVITAENILKNCPLDLAARFVVFVNSPREAFWDLHAKLARETSFYDNPAHRRKPAVGKGRISRSVIVHGGVSVGDNCVIGDHVVLLPGVKVGNNVILQPGAVIGSPGLDCTLLNGNRVRIPYVGGVKIDDDAEVGALSVIDQAMFACDTTIGRETKLGSCVRIEHDCQIGSRCTLGALVSVGHSTVICDDVRLGSGALISENLTIGVGAKISLGAIVTRDVRQGRTVSGSVSLEQHRLLRTLQSDFPRHFSGA
jgi:UDP-3-O-[3-hydroxymyristoyl] glucosamine N-acyltransferase